MQRGDKPEKGKAGPFATRGQQRLPSGRPSTQQQDAGHGGARHQQPAGRDLER